jgi:predicted DNA-binding transcriptional regulator AlpA
MKKRRGVLAKKGVLLRDYYTRKELAKALGFSIVTIARMDASGKGPPSIMLGGIRLYSKAGVQEWIEQASRTGAAPKQTPRGGRKKSQ